MIEEYYRSIVAAAPKHGVNDIVLQLTLVATWLHTLAAIASTFSKTMIRLRVASVLANAFGLVVAIVSLNPATLLRHVIILPIDVVRLREMYKLISNVKCAASSDLNVEWLKPFMRVRRFNEGAILFHKGDEANEAYLLVDGEIELPEIRSRLFPGTFFGEIALFTPDRSRTASALCRTDVALLTITYEQFEQLYFQNPEFGLYLLRLIVGRLRSDLALHEQMNCEDQP